MSRRWHPGALAAGALCWMAGFSAAGQDLLWVRQLGTSQRELGRDLAVDSTGGAYVTGVTGASLGGPSAGNDDAFLLRFDAAGVLLWARQFGTFERQGGRGVAVDSAGNAYICGDTYGDLSGPSFGMRDAFLARYDAAGNQLWVRQFGTPEDDHAYSVAVDGAGNAYVTGQVEGVLGGPPTGLAFLAKYDPSGERLWMREFGAPGQFNTGWGVAADAAGNAWVAGHTDGSLGGPLVGQTDAFLARFDPAGNQLWIRQFGTADREQGRDVAVDDAGNAYIAGFTRGRLGGSAGGDYDAFVARYSDAGDLDWVRQLGVRGDDLGTSVTIDRAGNAHLCGQTDGELGGTAAGAEDVFVARFDASGALLGVQQFGTTGSEGCGGIGVDSAGSIYIAGHTTGSFGGPSAGGWDAFVTRLGGCYPDCDSSGALDFFDLLCFLNVFGASGPYADCDGSGVHDFFDFLCFQEAFAAGCD